MSDLHVMAQTLRQLFDARQYQVADWFIDRCDRRQLEQLLRDANAVITLRIDYVVKKRLQRRSGVEAAVGTIEALPYVLNLWCREGRRSAVRSVLAELDSRQLCALGECMDLDPEVASMLREFHQ
ncbi:hypothetical protein [Dyella sp.]|uniref:hypothetical protein n=1 Tax=Dyella sp. TaxID=1869338 RepID=UPI002ED140C5